MNGSERALIVRTDLFGEPYPRTTQYAVPPRGAGLLGSGDASGATVVVLAADDCQVLGRWQGPEPRLGIRVASDGSVSFIAADDHHDDALAAAPLPTTAPCVPAP